MKPIVDAIGSSIMLLAVAAPMSCVQVTQRHDFQPFIAAAGAYALMSADAGPTPAPTPGDKCSNCNGVGRVSDGRVSVECPVCDGTGKATKPAPVSPPPAAAPVKKVMAAPCPNGNCPLPTRAIVR
jgi:hypothetical protein